jgi:hypothetical protein
VSELVFRKDRKRKKERREEKRREGFTATSSLSTQLYTCISTARLMQRVKELQLELLTTHTT